MSKVISLASYHTTPLPSPDADRRRQIRRANAIAKGLAQIAQWMMALEEGGVDSVAYGEALGRRVSMMTPEEHALPPDERSALLMEYADRATGAV